MKNTKDKVSLRPRMSTVAVRNSVFMHLAQTGGTAITRAFAANRAITYDYWHRVVHPFDKGYKYDKRCRLYTDKHDSRQYARVRGSLHSDLSDLRKEDLTKHKIAVVREPCTWYKAYWAAGHEIAWKNTPSPYLANGGNEKFEIWLDNMLVESLEIGQGFFTRYALKFVGDPETTKTQIVRFEHLAYDLHIALELLLEDWRTASTIKGLSLASKSDQLPMTNKQDGMIQMLDSWIYQFYP